MKIIVTDVDGTLINSYGDLSQKTIDTLLDFQARGNILILASGRSYYRMMKIAKQLQMDAYKGYLIDVNGIGTFDFKDNSRHRFYEFDKEEMQKLFDYFKSKEVEIKFYFDDGIFVYLPEEILEMKKRIRAEMKLPEDYPWHSGVYSWFCDNRDGYPRTKLITDLSQLEGKVNKVAISHDKHKLVEVQEEFLQSGLFDQYNFIFSAERQVDVVPKEVSKGKTLEYLLEKEGLKGEDLYVFGDSENDISMLELGNYAYIVSNADSKVVDQGFEMIGSNDQDALAKIVEKIEDDL